MPLLSGFLKEINILMFIICIQTVNYYQHSMTFFQDSKEKISKIINLPHMILSCFYNQIVVFNLKIQKNFLLSRFLLQMWMSIWNYVHKYIFLKQWIIFGWLILEINKKTTNLIRYLHQTLIELSKFRK